MPVFSFTAPHITSEEERQERESLSESKRQELLDDLYGVETSIDETPELIETKLRELEEEMDALDIQRKTDYLDAKARAPHLVDTEASPLKFLRCEKFNAKVSCGWLVVLI